jgi:hypothetical protein
MPALLIRKLSEARDVCSKSGAKKTPRREEMQSAREVDWPDFLKKPRRKVKDASDEIRKASR